MQGKHGHLTREQKQLALRLYASGWRLIDIAREIGCTAPMVGRMAREGRHLDGKPLGWEPREGQLTILEREQILTSLARGDTSMLVGLIVGRRIVQVPTLAEMDREVLVRLVSPGVQAVLGAVPPTVP